MAKIDKPTLGSIIVGGKKYRRDILVFADGIVKRRKARLRERILAYWFSHPTKPQPD